MKRPVTAFALMLAAITLAACLDDDITGTRPLSFTFVAETESAAPGESIGFSFEATGTSILGVIISFGDGVQDTTLGSPSTVEIVNEVRHAYEAAGNYDVIGTLHTASGNRADTIHMVIGGGGG